MTIRRIVLDVLKPIRGSSIVDLAERLDNLEGVDGVNISVSDMDVETMGLMVVVEGEDVDFKEVQNILEEEGCAIHSIDEVASGKRLVEGRRGK
ncbi:MULTISPECIES: DUF211 domain-containing protein [Metallosphaera]|uniref:DUF211 domain-containing protein n=3 Tax=Metallosphaera TaxID=41980 RepID=A4YI25_METS5|nr:MULTISPECIES: DUF211 domain-containing protein [Metallosphaera]ABP96077.1 protein of unknown function DUF211 [Metallosphaera sedula DSM 5348]AIM28061.1 protein of unknown function DUF211 [Metallosphaera sedula]AKV74892.1 hypothetical protein MsedA_1987 [Metallosphaera sedula]AKV77129.1 hypothetical protein MsedB_1989 [Metallosphaera sedula]AKV79380.1 hypothetical protein MsedC_1987 [Metallosphaera sedula]